MIDTMGSPLESLVTTTVQIGAGAALSAATTAGAGLHLVSVSVPANWTAAALTFQTVTDPATTGTYQEAADANGAAITVQVTAGQNTAVPPLALGRGWAGLKVRSGTASTPVNQTNAVTLTLVFARYT